MKLEGKRILVIGGAGFLGYHLTRKLLAENAEVIVLDNFSDGRKEYIPPACDLVEGDVCDKNSFAQIKDIDYIFNLGSPSSIILFNKNPMACANITVGGFVTVLEWAKANGVKKVVYPSSGSVYGNTPLPQSEEMTPKPANLYGVCKLACENIAKIYSNIPSVMLRVFAGYGPFEDHKGEFASVVTLFLNKIVKNESPVIYGDGTQSRDFVYIDDVVQAFLSSLEKGVEGAINVGSGKPYKFNELTDIINSLLGKEIEPVYVDKPVNYLENTQADITKMENLLNVKPLLLESGLERYLLQKGLVGR